MEINRRFVQLYGKIEVGKDYELGEDLRPTVTVVSKQIKDNDDGSVDVIYKAKLFIGEE